MRAKSEIAKMKLIIIFHDFLFHFMWLYYIWETQAHTHTADDEETDDEKNIIFDDGKRSSGILLLFGCLHIFKWLSPISNIADKSTFTITVTIWVHNQNFNIFMQIIIHVYTKKETKEIISISIRIITTTFANNQFAHSKTLDKGRESENVAMKHQLLEVLLENFIIVLLLLFFIRRKREKKNAKTKST